MFGSNDAANLDNGAMWPVAHTLTELTAAEEARIGARKESAGLRTEPYGSAARCRARTEWCRSTKARSHFALRVPPPTMARVTGQEVVGLIQG